MRIVIIYEDGCSNIAQDAATIISKFDQQFAIIPTCDADHSIIENCGIAIVCEEGGNSVSSMIANKYSIPVITLPVAKEFDDAMETIKAIMHTDDHSPHCCVSVNNYHNAALSAIAIASIGDPKLAKKLDKYDKSKFANKSKINQ